MPPAVRRRPGRRVAGPVALLFIAASLVPQPAPARAAAWADGSASVASERELVVLTNRSRARAGRRLLAIDPALTAVARWRSRDMVERAYFSHEIPPADGSVFDALSARGYCFDLAGENIGWNSYPDETATGVIERMFLESEGHRRNILGADWEVMGVGSWKAPDGRKMWTVLFADRCGPVVDAAVGGRPSTGLFAIIVRDLAKLLPAR
jgi:uncharacterized protein YkwD